MSDERSANMIDRRLGQRVRARRLEAGLSQERLAEILGLTFRQIQDPEKGVNRIAASGLFDIATALDVPVGFFFDGLRSDAPGGVGVDGPSGQVIDTLASPDGLQVLTLFGSIKNPCIRRRVVDVVRALADDETKLAFADEDDAA